MPPAGRLTGRLAGHLAGHLAECRSGHLSGALLVLDAGALGR